MKDVKDVYGDSGSTNLNMYYYTWWCLVGNITGLKIVYFSGNTTAHILVLGDVFWKVV